MKKPISIFILLIFSTQLSASFLHLDCNMKCCEESTISCCLSEESEKICPTIGVEGNCSTVILIPIISVPIQKIEIEDKLSFTNFISINGLNKIVFSNTVNP
ncbi:MAG: hypothetical protein QF769_04750, partial [Candidatus Marinimicrobia bacterium]|nr:hypothetical protein [Candidatus Neomarinimicrobiota bacterium]